MHSINIYFDENMTTREIIKLKREISEMQHVVDVEHPHHDAHNLTIEYETHPDMPTKLLEELRLRGLHPDVTSG